VTVVVTPSAREAFTPRELSAAYEDYIHRTRAAIRERPNRPQGRSVPVRCTLAHRLRGEPESGVVTLTTLEEQAAAERESGE
jgi:hypothetical protein